MSGVFLGPPLIVHALIAACVASLSVICFADGSYSRGQTLLFALAIAIVYFVLALLWGSRRILLRRRAHPAGESRDAGNSSGDS